MTDPIEGEALAVAVANVMEKQGQAWLGEVWRPDLGGAAGAEALEWLERHAFAYERGRNVSQGEVILRVAWGNPYGETTVRGSTIWEIVCRAIVAYGEQAYD